MSEQREGIWQVLLDPVDDDVSNIKEDVIPTSTPQVFCGFTTGNGKAIKISDDALKKARKFMESCDVIANVTNQSDSSSGAAKNTAVELDLSDNSKLPGMQLARCEEKRIVNGEEDKPKFDGFKTARGSDIPVSDAALQKAKKFLDDSEIDGPVLDLKKADYCHGAGLLPCRCF